MKLAIKTAALAGAVLLGSIATGCAAPGGGTGQVTVAGCTAYGVHAIEHHITVTRRPAACRGLSQAEVNQAAAIAVRRATEGAPKAVWRKRATAAAAFLSHLVTGPVLANGSPPAVPPASPGSTAARSGRPGRDLAMDLAALLAWIVTAGSGSYVLGTWVVHGGTLRPRAAVSGAPPVVVFAHFGLALSGLVLWIVYLTTDWAPLAWTAVGVLLPVAGLGMATLATGLPGRAPGPSPAPAVAAGVGPRAGPGLAAGRSSTASSMGGPGPLRPGGIARTGTRADGAGPGAFSRIRARGRLSALVVVAHGVLAVTTVLLVLLAALGTAAG